jgi:hypothetical protein
MHPNRPTRLVVDAQHIHVGPSHQQLTHAKGVLFHQGLSDLKALNTVRLAGPPVSTRGLLHPVISEAPV